LYALQNQRNSKWPLAGRLPPNAGTFQVVAERRFAMDVLAMDVQMMSEKELHRMAKTKRKGKPTKTKRRYGIDEG
jgi:hypothetical protein